jgi:hypothetical protein
MTDIPVPITITITPMVTPDHRPRIVTSRSTD